MSVPTAFGTRYAGQLRAGVAAISLVLVTLAAITLVQFLRSTPEPPPPDAGAGRIGLVLEETVRTASTAALRAHLDAEAGSRFCVVGYTIRESLRGLGVEPADIPNYWLDSDRWAYVVTRPAGPHEYAIVGTGRIWPNTARQCWAAEQAELLVTRRPRDGLPSVDLTVQARTR